VRPLPRFETVIRTRDSKPRFVLAILNRDSYTPRFETATIRNRDSYAPRFETAQDSYTCNWQTFSRNT
ncbi:MAG: hypothetical protein QGF59_32450, partial [Pirellulaceae bacterium]|nr:hypothetical protein [Pirellulaceae bacterium]